MIIFSDFDHTFYHTDDPVQTEANLKAVKQWRSAGHQFAVITGRSYLSFTRQFPALAELCGYFVLDGGSLIYDHAGNLLYSASFAPSSISAIVDITRNAPESPISLYYTADSEFLVPPSAPITKIRPYTKTPVETDSLATRFSILPDYVFTNHHANNQIHPELAGYHAFVELIPADSGKSNAVRALADLKNLAPSDIIVVGDGENDREMISDWHGYMIAGSKLAQSGATFKSTPSLATLIDAYLKKTYHLRHLIAKEP